MRLFVKKLKLLEHNFAVVIDIHKPKEEEINWYGKLLVTTRRFAKGGQILGEKARDFGAFIRKEKGKAFAKSSIGFS